MKSNQKNKGFSQKAVQPARPRPHGPKTPSPALEDFDSLNILCAHAARTLPDSLAERKQLLAALANVMRLGHPATQEVNAQMTVLRGFEAMQAELADMFEKRKAEKRKAETETP